jgi:hypothetical protein
MGNDLIPQDFENNSNLTNFEDVTSGGSSFPSRLQLFGAKSGACTDGLIPIGHWGLVDDSVITDLGTEVDIILADWRPKAVDSSGDAVLVEYDTSVALFKEIMAKSDVPDSGCMFGPEYLVYVPGPNKYATLFMCSKTARRESKKMQPYLRQGITLKSKVITKDKYKWHGPVSLPCSTPLTPPDLARLTLELERFRNPPKNEVESVDDSSNRG